jgi:predicted ATP-grasp superfamily ATP-dependent carboligase
MPREYYDALILDAKLRQSLVSVRSLGRCGKRVAALEVENLAAVVPTFSSRWCRRAFVAPAYEHGADRFVTFLERLLDDVPVGVLIPSSDGTIAVVRQYRERLGRRVRIPMAREAALAVAINKPETLALARCVGVRVPRGVQLTNGHDLPAALREIGLPVVVKPVESWVCANGHAGVRLACRLATTLHEARQAVDELLSLGQSVLVQQFLSGEREAVHLFYVGGEVYARFAQWAKRMQPPLGGTSVFRQSIAVPDDIGEQSERLVRALDLEGYCEVEFRRDAAGNPYLMEINPRLSASVELAVRAGVDFPQYLYQWANGERLNRVPRYRVGGWMRYLQGDFKTTLECLSQRGRPGVPPPARAVLDFATAFFVPAGYDYFAWNDILPSLTATRDFAGVALRSVRARGQRALVAARLRRATALATRGAAAFAPTTNR